MVSVPIQPFEVIRCMGAGGQPSWKGLTRAMAWSLFQFNRLRSSEHGSGSAAFLERARTQLLGIAEVTQTGGDRR